MKYIFSSSPHVKSSITTKRIMLDVCIALLPSCIVGCIMFGLDALWLLLISSATAVVSEIVYKLLSKVSLKKAIAEFDFTSLVTGMLVGMNLYADCPWYVAVLSSVFAIVIVKMLFGGTGRNIVNPAIAGRIFAYVSFGAGLGGTMNSLQNFDGCYQLIDGHKVGATPLTSLYNPNVVNDLSNLDLFLGTGVNGTIGEVCKLALIVGGIYLIVRNVIDWRWPLVYIVTTGLFTVVLNGFNFATFLPSILSGGLMLGAIFMATDYVTSPATKLGNYIYFVALGLITAGLRQAVGFEVVSFAILLMNIVLPLIDMYVVNKPFGWKKPSKEVA